MMGFLLGCIAGLYVAWVIIRVAEARALRAHLRGQRHDD